MLTDYRRFNSCYFSMHRSHCVIERYQNAEVVSCCLLQGNDWDLLKTQATFYTATATLIFFIRCGTLELGFIQSVNAFLPA